MIDLTELMPTSHAIVSPTCSLPSMRLEIGEVHPHWETLGPQLPVDRAVYNYTAAGHSLNYYYSNPTGQEIEDFTEGLAQFAFVEFGPVLYFLHAFGTGLPWSDSPYSIHLVPEEYRGLPELSLAPDERALLWLTLTDRATGEVRGLRAVSWAPGFTNAFHAAIHRQAMLPFERREHDEYHAAAYRRWPKTSDMLSAVVAHTFGGV